MGGIDQGQSARHARTMEEAADTVPEGAAVRLSLPVSAVLMERMKLPSTDRDELGGMVVLQLEKTLPYSGSELTSGFEIIGQENNQSDLLAIAVSNQQLDSLCQPLRTRRMLPDQVTIFALQLAAKFPAEEVLALIFREVDSTILAIAQKGKLVAAHASHGADPESFLAELPRLLLSAELEGAPVSFTKVVVERDLADWRESLTDHFGKTPVELAPMDEPLDQGPVNLIPAGWTLEQQELAHKARMREWLMLAGAVYLALLLLAAGYIIWLQRQVAGIDAKVNAANPAINTITDQKARWTTLAPAIDPNRYTVELLQQIDKSIPSSDLHVTVFDQSPEQFMVEGEAPTASMAVQYMEALRGNPGLSDYQFDITPPAMVTPDHWRFRITGKL